MIRASLARRPGARAEVVVVVALTLAAKATAACASPEHGDAVTRPAEPATGPTGSPSGTAHDLPTPKETDPVTEIRLTVSEARPSPPPCTRTRPRRTSLACFR